MAESLDACRRSSCGASWCSVRSPTGSSPRPRTKAYGAVSVLVQLAARARASTRSRRTVFRPPPNVESALVAFERRDSRCRFADVRRVVEGAFAYRRKTLANSLSLSGARLRASAQCGARRHRPRAERSRRGARAPRVRRARGSAAMSEAPAPAKINLALVVGPRREDGKHEVVTVMQRVTSTTASAPSPRPRYRRLPGRHDRHGGRSRRSQAPPAWSRAGSSVSRSRSPSLPGLAAAARTPPRRSRLANASSPSRSPHDDLARAAATIGADVPFFLVPAGRSSGQATGPSLRRVELPARLLGRARPARGRDEGGDGAVYDAFDEREGATGFAGRADALLEALASRRRSRDLRRSRRTTSPPRRSRRSRRARRLPGRRHRRRPDGVRALRRRAATRPTPRHALDRSGGPSSRARSRRTLCREWQDDRSLWGVAKW